MKRVLSFFILIVIGFLSCDEHELNSPYDSKINIAPPSNLAISQNGEWIQMTWQGNEQIRSGYEIHRKAGEEEYKLLTTINDAKANTFLDTTSLTNIPYYYRLFGLTDTKKTESVDKFFKASFPAPTNLNYTVLSDTSLQLNWQHVCAFETGYEIERQTAGGSAWQTVKTTPANVLTFTDNGLVYRQNYNYRVRAITRKNQTAYVERNALSTTFPAPVNLQAEALNDSEIKLTWQHNCAYETGFIIERRQEGIDWQMIGQPNADIFEFTDSGLLLNITYDYRIKAFTAKSQSDYSNIAAKRTFFPDISNFQATPLTETEIKLTWTHDCIFEKGYRLERQENAGEWLKIAEPEANVTEYKDTDLSYGPAYSYRISAFTNLNQSNYSSIMLINSTFPAPANLTATPLSDSQIKLDWQHDCAFESGYRVQRKDAVNDWADIAVNLAENTFAWTDENVDLGKEYSYRVLAFTQNNVSDWSNVISKQTIFPAPNNLTATPFSDSQIKLQWQHNCAYESGYRVYRRESGGAFIEIGQTTANELTYTDASTNWDSDYSYQVCAYTAKNQSDFSTPQAINISQVVAPGNLQIQLGINELKLTWADNCTFESGYHVERDDGTGWQALTDAAANVKEYIDIGLDNTKTYSYKVCAIVNARQSAYSAPVSGKPQAAPLEAMILVQGGSFTMGDTWGDGYSNETPTHSVTLSSFYIGKYEVMQKQWVTVMGSDPGFYWKGDNLPVEYVTWYQMVDFCNKLSQREGLTPCYTINGTSVTCNWSAKGYRLPTEAEWEYAARGGPSDTNPGKYSGSDSPDGVAWYSSNSGSKTHDVGAKTANELGLHDMSGNVWEWCWDWYAAYSSSAQTNPHGSDSGASRVLRGGSWLHNADAIRVANRSYSYPDSRGSNRGFRLVRAF